MMKNVECVSVGDVCSICNFYNPALGLRDHPGRARITRTRHREPYNGNLKLADGEDMQISFDGETACMNVKITFKLSLCKVQSPR
jgi:hypothetical protein